MLCGVRKLRVEMLINQVVGLKCWGVALVVPEALPYSA